MRTNLFLSTLFAVSLVGGAAMADKPGHERPAREPRAIEAFRAHGDTFDKTYRSADPTAQKLRAGDTSSKQASAQRSPMQNDRASSRINCSDTGADCGSSSRSSSQAARGARAGSSFGAAQSSKSPISRGGNERMNCNEADECTVSSKGAQKTWAGSGAASPTDKPAAAVRSQDERTGKQASDARMSCNEADECMMSSKDSKKIWAMESVKVGTFSGAANAAAQKDASQERARKEQKDQDRKAQEQSAKEKSAKN